MLSEQRYAAITSLVAAKKTVTIHELAAAVGVSLSTIRRDLAVLDLQGSLTKIYGGAAAKSETFTACDASVGVRLNTHREEKQMIAQYAASLIQADDFVYLDAGTTTGFMIDFITEKHAVFVTDCFSHAKRLSENGMRVYILGGEVKQQTEAIIGAEAAESLAKYHFTKGFWGTNGISLSTGFTTPDLNEALIKKTSMLHTREKYVVSDASKFSCISCVSFAAFTQASIITTALTHAAYKDCSNIIVL